MKDERIRYQAMATWVWSRKRECQLIWYCSSTPLNKIATPLEVAYQIAMLASEKVSGHVTGQIVRLHGGMEGTCSVTASHCRK